MATDRRPRRGGPQAPAKKWFGQHFLESAWADKVARAIDPQPGDTIIEIGPGRGAITERLAARAGRVIAYEIDRDLVEALRVRMPANVTTLEGDFLAVSPFAIAADVGLDAATGLPGAGDRLRAAGNLPYNVASPILFALTALPAAGVPLADATVMLQKEVADRLLAAPGTKEYGVLTVLIGHRASIDRLLRLPPGAFRPPPKVQSSVVRLRFHAPDPPVRDAAVFAAVTQAMFSRRRKTLANALLAYASTPEITPKDALNRAGIDPSRRPETLTIAEIATLADVYAPAVV